MFRGIELILKGRDPRDAWVFTQRICGVCTTSPRHRVHPRSGERNRRPPSHQRPPASQPHHGDADGPGPRDPLLSPARPGLGGCGVGPVPPILRRPRSWPSPISDWHLSSASYFNGVQGQARRVRRARTARSLRQCLLGPQRLQAPAGGEPAGGGALPGGAGLAAGVHHPPRRARRQEPSPAVVPGRRHGHTGGPGQAGVSQHRNHRPAAGSHRPGGGLRKAGVRPRPAGHRVVLQGVGRVGRRRGQLPGVRRVPAG